MSRDHGHPVRFGLALDAAPVGEERLEPGRQDQPTARGRDAQRRRHASTGSSLPRPGLVPPVGDGSLSDEDVGDTDVSGANAAAPFEEIEQW